MKILLALIKKEILQIFRDPSSIMIAFVLPLILLFIFGYGINLDTNRVRIGLVLEDSSSAVTSLVSTFKNSSAIELFAGYDRKEFEELIIKGDIKGIVIIPSNFTESLASGLSSAKVQLIIDGSDPNSGSFVKNYVKGVMQTWSLHEKYDQDGAVNAPLISLTSVLRKVQ